MIQGKRRMDNESAVRGLFSVSPKTNIFIGLLLSLYYFLIGVGGIPVRLLMRRNLGERAFSFLGLVTCLLFYLFLAAIIWDSIWSDCMNDNYDVVTYVEHEGLEYWKAFFFYLLIIFLNPISFFIVFIFAKGLSHFKKVFLNIIENEFQYSKYRGDGIYFNEKLGGKFWGLEVNDLTIRMLIEPVSVIRICLPLYIICYLILSYIGETDVSSYFSFFLSSTFLGFLIVNLFYSLSAVFVFLEELATNITLRNSALDLIDAEAESDLIYTIKKEISNGRKLAGKDTGIFNVIDEKGLPSNQSDSDFSVVTD